MSGAESISKQAQTIYEDYKKIKAFVDVGYFLLDYVVTGGEVTKDVTYNNQINVAEIVVSLDNDVTRHEPISFKTKTRNTTYYLDYLSEGKYSFGTTHYSGSHLPIAEVTTDANGNVSVIIDKRGDIGGFRLRPGYEYPEIAELRDEFAKHRLNPLSPPTPLVPAKGDGVNNDRLAIQALIDYAETLGGAEIYLPPGKYKISGGKLTIKNMSINLVGAGIKVTTLFFDTVNDGIFYTANDLSQAFTAKGFSIVSLTANLNTTALNLTYPDNSGSSWKNVTIEDISIDTCDSIANYYNNNAGQDVNYWGVGLLLNNCAGATVRNCFIRGKYTGKPSTGIRLMGWTVDVRIESSILSFHKVAILKTGALEGITIDKVTALHCDKFVIIQNELPIHLTDAGVHAVINNCHAGCSVTCIEIKGHPQVFITNNLLYNGSDNDGNFQHINILNSSGVIISNNMLTVGDGSAGYGIYIENSSMNNINGNIINGVFFPVTLLANSQECIVTGNHLNKDVSNLGTNNLVFNNIDSSATRKFAKYAPSYTQNTVKTLTGGAATEVLTVTVPTGYFTSVPSAAYITCTDSVEKIIGLYDSDASTATSLKFTLTKTAGGNLSAGARRFNVAALE